jgi:DNA-binding SARP family transcriptional activator
VEFRILGPLEVLHEGVPVALGGARQRAVLTILLLHVNRTLSAHRLIKELWADQPPISATSTLHGYVSHLRRVLEPERQRRATSTVLVSRASGYELRVPPNRLDSHRFERLVIEGRRALEADEPSRAREALRAGLDLWRGPALADFAEQAFAQPAITQLEELRLVALETRIDADLALGRHAELIGELDALVADHPLRERLWGQLMLAMYRSGRQAEALGAYRQTRALLADELGIDPGGVLQDLERAILRQAPALDWSGPGPTAPALDASARVEVGAGDDLPRPRSLAPHKDQVGNGPTWSVPARESARPNPLPEARKTVTVVSCAVVPSDASWPSTDPEALDRMLTRWVAAAGRAIARHGGTTEQAAGDVVLAVFGFPVLNEDDPLRAVLTAAALRDVAASLDEELERDFGVCLAVRIGGVPALVEKCRA